jgi:4-aminobutyrate aminotransferase-like enzyme
MGDVHPPEAKLAFLRSLAEFLPAELGNILLSCNGSDACESALKTAQIHTGRSQFLAFTGSYHGLGYGALSVTHKSNFRIPFRARLLESDTHFARFPNLYREGKEDGRIILEQVDFLLSGREIAGLIIEPIQGRGGVLVPPEGFLPELRKLCHKYGTLLIFDEIYTGLYRTGTKLACLHENVLPDLLCLGKLLGGGLPLSACVGKPSVMASWGRSEGEAIHTSTFLGNPLICRAGEAVIKELQSNDWASIVSGKGTYLESLLRSDLPKSNIGDIRGRGLLWGIELVKQGGEPSPELARYIVKAGLKRGLILLPGGSYGNVLTLSPPFVISHVDLDYLVSSLAELLMNGQASL